MSRLADGIYARIRAHRGHDVVENEERTGGDAFVEDEPHAFKAGVPSTETYNPSGMRRAYEGLRGRFP